MAAAAGVAGAMRANALPIVLTRVGLERPAIAATVEAFVATAHGAEADLSIVDVPSGRHSFDLLDHTDESRQAVTTALDRVLTNLLSAGPRYSREKFLNRASDATAGPHSVECPP